MIRRLISFSAMGIFLFGIMLLSGCSTVKDVQGEPVVIEEYPSVEVLDSDEGIASYYHNRFHGRKTASGEMYDKTELTAAHRRYPFGTIVRVTSLENGSSIIVRVNDRGPSIRTRVIDLSYEAAKCLEMVKDGLIKVRLDILQWGES